MTSKLTFPEPNSRATITQKWMLSIYHRLSFAYRDVTQISEMFSAVCLSSQREHRPDTNPCWIEPNMLARVTRRGNIDGGRPSESSRSMRHHGTLRPSRGGDLTGCGSSENGYRLCRRNPDVEGLHGRRTDVGIRLSVVSNVVSGHRDYGHEGTPTGTHMPVTHSKNFRQNLSNASGCIMWRTLLSMEPTFA